MTSRLAVAGAAAGATFATAVFAVLLALHLTGGASVDVPWAPTIGARLQFELDGIGALYGLLAAGVGAAVFAYAAGDIPHHLREAPAFEAVRFHLLLGLFLVAMVVLATARDLVVLFVAWDVTAICSYLLIAVDRTDKEVRRAALMALLITGISAVALLIAVLILGERFGTFDVADLARDVPAAGGVTSAAVLIAIAALAKSAQVPLHFWLPRAMAAPTPVSAYLHSAAMVAAGVLLLTRLHPLLAPTAWLLDALVAVGLLSMLVGGALALAEDRLKRVLAYSTVAQYGYVVLLLGIGTPKALAAASYYVLAHGIAKSALFMVAGGVIHATGEDRLSRVGGLARAQPALAVAGAVGCASLAALPLTAGFFADELLFAVAAEHGTWIAGLSVAGAALTFAYMLRFWAGTFTGRRQSGAGRVEPAFVVPPLLLAAAVLVAGVVSGPLRDLAADAGTVAAGTAASAEASYKLEATTENLMALAAWAGGLLLFAGLGRLAIPLRALYAAGRAVGPEAVYVQTLRGLNRLSDRLHAVELADLRGKLTAVLVPGGVLVAAALVAAADTGSYEIGDVPTRELVLIAALAIVVVAAIAATQPRVHARLIISVSAVGFSLAVVYALLGAPDVALVAAVIETLLTLLFLGVLALIPSDTLEREADLHGSRGRRRRDVAIGAVAGTAALATTWSALSSQAPGAGAAAAQLARTQAAHGEDTVTVILADFRGLDTLGEVTVVFIALIGVAALLRRGRLW